MGAPPPSRSAKQARFMKAACTNPKTKQQKGMDKKVACAFYTADKAKKKKKK